VTAGAETVDRIDALAKETGLSFEALSEFPARDLHSLSLPRVGLYKSWVANMDEGWTRWLLERYAFPVDTLHDADLRPDHLVRYDAVILPDQSADALLTGHAPGTMPAEYTGGIGLEGALALKRFVEDGGTLLAFDGAGDFAIEQFGLPLRNVVKSLSSQRFFVPGSLVKLDVDTTHLLASGMPATATASFQQSRAFEAVRLDEKGEGGREQRPAAPAPNVEVVARYAMSDLLQSGWALGEEEYLAGKAAVVRVPMGQGSVVLIGFRPQFRGQPGGTFKFIFNTLHAAGIRIPTEETR
jgi:hypothetical protein